MPDRRWSFCGLKSLIGENESSGIIGLSGLWSIDWGPISAKMVRTSSMTMPSMVGIVGRAPAVDEKVPCSLSVCLFVTLWN